MADTYSNKAFTIALGLFIVLLASYAFLQSPFFSLQSIELLGNDYLTEDDVLEVGEVYYGINLTEIDVRALSDALRELPVVAEVRVSRRLPSTLVLRITERSPVAYVSGERRFWTVDGSGMLLFPSDTLTKPLPLITSTPEITPRAGGRLQEPHLLAALRFAQALTLKGQTQLAEVHASDDGITAFTTDRITVNLGVTGDMQEKAAVLEALLARAAQGNLSISHVDVRHPRSPVVEEKR